MTQRITVKNLAPGQEVVPMNCATSGRVIRRVGKNRYLVSYQSHEIEMMRQSLAVNVRGRWLLGPHNEIL